MNEFRHYCNTTEPTKTVRVEMCAVYRKIRSTRPDMARLLWRRMTNATNIIKDDVWKNLTTGGSSGLGDLLKRHER